MEIQCDLLIQNALVFDGTGELPATEDIAITDGKISARGINLNITNADRTVDATGKWLMPGLLDIHTHMDLELELSTRLEEVVRHGTTTCVVGNCSIGTAFGSQRHKAEDPILDCFARVETCKSSIPSIRSPELIPWTVALWTINRANRQSIIASSMLPNERANHTLMLTMRMP